MFIFHIYLVLLYFTIVMHNQFGGKMKTLKQSIIYKIAGIVLLSVVAFAGHAQENPLHISHKSVYAFLDEMASLHLIDINTAIKPYSRSFVAEKLQEVQAQEEQLNKVQRQELAFHLLEFNLERDADKSAYKINAFKNNEQVNLCLYPLGLYYNNKWFKISVKPIWGIEYYVAGRQKEQRMYRYWGGGEMVGYIGKHVGFYANFTDNSQSQPMSTPEKLTQMQGAILKGQTQSTDYFNVRGGITCSWKWGSLALIKDNIAWGNAYHGSNILSGRTLPYVMIKFRVSPVEWFEYNYFNGWLASNLIDSAASYVSVNGHKREVMRSKLMAANMLTFRPVKNLYINVGNSIVYSDMGFQLQYVVPFLFFKGVDDNYNATSNTAGHNTQMFFDISSRNVKYLHLYASMFIDELSFKRMFNKQKQSNYVSTKVGACFSGLPKTFSLTLEYTRTNPNVYQHFMPAVTFASGDVCLGHYLGSNADEIYAEVAYRPVQRLHLKASYTYIRKGTDYRYGVGEPWGLPCLDNIIYYNHIAALQVEWEFMNNSFVYAHAYWYKTAGEEGLVEKYNPPYMQKTTGLPIAIMAGFNIGF